MLAALALVQKAHTALGSQLRSMRLCIGSATRGEMQVRSPRRVQAAESGFAGRAERMGLKGLFGSRSRFKTTVGKSRGTPLFLMPWRRQVLSQLVAVLVLIVMFLAFLVQ